jgi:hypothetical protein
LLWHYRLVVKVEAAGPYFLSPARGTEGMSRLIAKERTAPNKASGSFV